MLQRTFSVLSLLETCPFIKDKALGLYVSFSPVLQSVHPPPPLLETHDRETLISYRSWQKITLDLLCKFCVFYGPETLKVWFLVSQKQQMY